MDEDLWTMDAMEQHGGGFVSALGAAARRADGFNLERIKVAFPELWDQYREIGKGMELFEWQKNNKSK